jgi:hypothetical protein
MVPGSRQIFSVEPCRRQSDEHCQRFQSLSTSFSVFSYAGHWRHRRESKHKLTRLQDASLHHITTATTPKSKATPPKQTMHHPSMASTTSGRSTTPKKLVHPHPVTATTPGRTALLKKPFHHAQSTTGRSTPPKKPLTYKSLLRDARKILDNYQRLASNSDAHTDELLVLDTQDQNLLWFLQPREVYDFIFEPEAFDSPDRPLPFRPRRRSSTYRHPPLLHAPNLPGSPELTDEELKRGCNSKSPNCQSSILDSNATEPLSPVHQDIDNLESDGSISDHEGSVTPPNTEEKLHMFLESTSSGDSAFQSTEYNEEDGFEALFGGFRRLEDQAMPDSQAFKTPTRHHSFSDSRSRETEPRGFSSLLKIEENYYSPIAPRKRILMEDASTSPVADPYALLPPLSKIVCNQLTHRDDSVKSPGNEPAKYPAQKSAREPFIEDKLDELKLRPPIKNLMKSICLEAANIEAQNEFLSQDRDQNQSVTQDQNEQMNKDLKERVNKDHDEHVAQDQKERASKDQINRPSQDQECTSSDDDQLNMSLVSIKTSGKEEDHNESVDSGKKQKKRTKKQKKKKKELCTIM